MTEELTGSAKHYPEEMVKPEYLSYPPQNSKQIEWRQFQLLCELQCTQAEIAAVLGVDVVTLIRHVEIKYGEPYMQVYEGFAAGGRPSLRRSQRVLADKHPAMAIWLGRHWLDQNEDTKTANQGSYTINLVHYGKGAPQQWEDVPDSSANVPISSNEDMLNMSLPCPSRVPDQPSQMDEDSAD